jgi:hypothetical protein
MKTEGTEPSTDDLAGAPLEPVVEAQTTVGPLLLPSADEVITPTLCRYGVWEPGETRFLRALVRPGDVFVDVGAHVGYFSLLAASRVGEEGAVIAVEPEPRNLRLLRANLARNGASRARVIPLAAYSHSVWMSLACDEHNRGGHRLVRAGQLTSSYAACASTTGSRRPSTL